MSRLEVKNSALAPEQPRTGPSQTGLVSRPTDKKVPLEPEELRNAYGWRAANYLSVGQISTFTTIRCSRCR